MSASSAIDEIVDNCLAVRVRLIGRAVTAIYDRAISVHGVTIAQVNLMAALGRVGPCPPSRLGAILQLERSTVSRNLEILLKAGWVVPVSTDGKGIRDVKLSSSGRRKVESIIEAWRAAQRETSELLGANGVRTMHDVVDRFWGSDAQS